MLEFACPKCSEAVRSAEDQAGEQILCPKCSQMIRVPGEKSKPDKKNDEWSVFDEDEKFIEESVAKQPDVKYRTAEDDRDPIVDNDEEAARQEELEEKAAVAETLSRAKMHDLSAGPGVSSDMTVDEKIKQDAKFQAELESLPPDSPLRQKKAWDREQGESADSIRLENQPAAGNSISARCTVCDSVTMVGDNKAGSTVVCSDCGSNIVVPSKAEANAEDEKQKQEWERWALKEKEEDPQAKQVSKIADELFVIPPEEEEDGYGLAPAPENLLQPVTPIYEDSEVSPDEEKGAGHQQSHTSAPASEPEELETSKLFEEMQAEKQVSFERLPWTQHIFGVFADPGFLIRVMVSVAVMVIGYSIFWASTGLADMDGNRLAKVMSFLGKFIQMWSLPFLLIGFLMICWLGQKVLNSTIVGDKKMPDIEGTSVLEWLSNCLFVAVGFAIGAFPGILIGALAWTQFEEWQGFWTIPALGTMSAMLISPLIILSSMQNQSPFKIISQKISDSINQVSDAWIEFYLTASVTAVITGGLWFLAMTEMWVVAVVMFVAINLGFGLYFRMLGRLMGIIVNHKKKKKDDKSKA